MIKNLVIVESPAKANTIAKYLGKDFVVKSCYGHVRDLSQKEFSIDIKNDFQPIYYLIEDKKNIIKELKKLSQEAEKVWLATDEDREGEAISWHLMEALNLDEHKTERITFNEITKNAIQEAIKNPRKINYQLVDAQQARRVLDRIVGYELSPLLWKKIKPALSAGRVQSVAVRLIVEREEEIKNFKEESSYRVSASFKTSKNENFKAQLNHRFVNRTEAISFLEKCVQYSFVVLNVETKPFFKTPSAPFTTSSLQQEASRKLNFPVAKTMQIAQQLYENGYITYMRTDSTHLSDEAIKACKKEIVKIFGEKYANPRQYATKIKGAQEAHEAIRPTNMSVHSLNLTKDQNNLYELIWKRTIASQMANAKFDRTIVTINAPDEYIFEAKGEVMLFDGFLKVYTESYDDDPNEEETHILPKVNVNEQLKYQEIIATQKFTQPPPRYNEASLVKKLEDLGIGRPSTYAPIISTILKREYVVKQSKKGVEKEFEIIKLSNNKIEEKKDVEIVNTEKNKLFPTDIGILVTKFLTNSFAEILDYKFTATIEKEFDDIAQGKLNWKEMIKKFYDKFHPKIEQVSNEKQKIDGERFLGIDPETGEKVFVKIGKYGPIVQIGESNTNTKPKFANLLKTQSINTITLEEALKLFKLPLKIGEVENKEIQINVGPYGPYIKFDNKFYPIPEKINPFSITIEEALKIINEKENKSPVIRNFPEQPDLQIIKGKWGAYIKYKNENFKIPKDKKIDELTLEECLQIVNNPELKTKTRKKK